MPNTTLDPRRWKALWIIAVAQFLVIMDTSIIGVALPDIQEALGFSQADLSWVFNAYVVAFGGLLLLGGKLSDVYGPRRSLHRWVRHLAGGSLVAGLADTSGVEIAGRAVQGAGRRAHRTGGAHAADGPVQPRPARADQGDGRSTAPPPRRRHRRRVPRRRAHRVASIGAGRC